MSSVDRLAAMVPAQSGVIGYAPGIFDLFHIGHVNLLRRAKERCDFLIAGVVSDDMCSLRKGRTPVVPLDERLEIVRNMRCVDLAIEEDVPSKVDVWNSYRFHRLFKGDDWEGTPAGVRLQADFAPLGVEIVYLPYTLTTSSTILRSALDVLTRAAL
jgi:glycerol-3-phosphate cytidylyltransferase